MLLTGCFPCVALYTREKQPGLRLGRTGHRDARRTRVTGKAAEPRSIQICGFGETLDGFRLQHVQIYKGGKHSKDAAGDAAMLKPIWGNKRKKKRKSVLFLHWEKNVTRQRCFRISQTPIVHQKHMIHTCLKFKSGHQMASRCVYEEICPARCCFAANSG